MSPRLGLTARAVVAAIAVASVGCGTTTILTNEPSARIIVEGRMVGRGQGEIGQRGMPGSTTVTVQADDGRRGQAVISRRFTGLTLLTGFFTYGICFIACWEYPSTVMVPLPAAQLTPPGGGADPWLMPPPGWQAKR